MHCHVSQGSVDSKVSVESYIETLQQKGIQGMLITDHNTYNGYRYWKKNIAGKQFLDFVVLKGIEYDTRDAGHIIVIMPMGVKMKLLELRGLSVQFLIEFVHRNGGVLGPAHPCGEKYMSYTNTKCYIKRPEIIKRFDFIEVYNACEPDESNASAKALAVKYRKFEAGGSDSHRIACVGTGYTEFEEDIKTELDLIDVIRKKKKTYCGGEGYSHTTKDKLGKAKSIMAYSFWVYNKGGAWFRKLSRVSKGNQEDPSAPIDPIEMEYWRKHKKFHLPKRKL